MKLLVTGKGGAGSWTVRGEQLGAAIGATVKPHATRDDVRDCDLAIVVKRTPDAVIEALRAERRRWVLDVVDFYPQPLSSAWSQAEAVRWVRDRVAALRPTALIWPNKRMADDCAIDLPSTVLYHHHRPQIALNPIRERVRTVGYEGAPAYLAGWQRAVECECLRRGWQFVANPTRLADLDIVLAVRGGAWDGYVPAHWKSNVKLANAHGSGTPFVGQAEQGYLETASGAEYWAAEPAGLRTCFEWLEDQGTREQVRDRFLQRAYPLERAAEDLLGFLRGL